LTPRAIGLESAALGYIEEPGDDDEKTLRDTLAGNQMSLAQSLTDSGDLAELRADNQPV